MYCPNEIETTEASHAMNVPRLTVKDVEGRLNTFDNAEINICYILDDKFYKIQHAKGVEYYNPSNIVFLSF